MTKRRTRTVANLRREEGAVLIMAAGMIVVLMGFVGLGLDTGSLFNHKRALQTAADGGALQGGYEIYRGNTSLITSAANTGSSENGYTHNSYGVNVEVYNPPITGYYVGDDAAVEVVVSQPSPITFMTLFGFAEPTVPARAVAWAGANSQNCIHVLEDTKEAAFNTQSSHVLNAPDCGLVVNSSHNRGGRLESNSLATVADATFTGNYQEQSSSDLVTTGSPPYTGVYPRAPDPLAYLVDPNTSGCDHNDMDVDQNNITLWPGNYCGETKITNDTHAYMMPGLYIFKGKGLKVEGDSLLESHPSGVTLYFTERSGDFEGFSFSSNAQADLNAPINTADPYFGILFWADPTAGDEDVEFRFESNTSHDLSGAVYLPNHVFNPESSSVINSEYLIIVVRQYIGESNSVVNIGTNFPGGGAGVSPLKRLALVE